MSSAQDLPAENESAAADPSRADAPAEPPDASLAAVQAALAELTVLVGREHERAAHREAIIDRLHDEVQTLRRGELSHALQPVRSALYRLHDKTRRAAGRWHDDPPHAEQAAAVLATVADEIADALGLVGAERFAVRPGEPFDAARHRPISVETVTDPVLDGAVTRVHADGFRQDDKVVRKAEVSVGRLSPHDTHDAPDETE